MYKLENQSENIGNIDNKWFFWKICNAERERKLFFLRANIFQKGTKPISQTTIRDKIYETMSWIKQNVIGHEKDFSKQDWVIGFTCTHFSDFFSI